MRGQSASLRRCAAAKAHGLDFLLAAEFSTDYRERVEYGVDFHIVGIEFDLQYPAMKEYLWQLSRNEAHQTERCFRQGLAAGYISGITWEEVLDFNRGISWLCNEHVYRAMKAKGLVTDLEYSAFFTNVFGMHRFEEPPLHPFHEPTELIALIRAAGGIPIVAHPHDRLCYLDRLRESGLLGLEVWASSMTKAERVEALRYATEHDMYVSGGSDHGRLMGGQYSRYVDPRKGAHWLEPCSMGTQRLFFEELRERTLATRHERLEILHALEAEVAAQA